MRILVLGAGGTGGYFGGRLVESGADVSFLVRPVRAERLNTNGLRILSPIGDFSAPVQIVTELDGKQSFDLVLLSCKAYDLDSAIAAIRPAIGASTRILPLLNGLKHFDILDAEFGRERVLGGLCHISVTLGDGGEIRHLNTIDRLTFGSRDTSDATLEKIAGVLLPIKAQVRRSTQISIELWEKFIFLASLAGITCLMRASVGDITATRDGRKHIRAVLATCAEVAQRCGFAPRPRNLREAEAVLCSAGSPLQASMLRDIERGGMTEGEHILGDMLDRALGFEIPCDVLAMAYCHVQAYEQRCKYK